MDAKTLGGGAVVLLGIGGFLAYNQWEQRKEQKKVAEARAQAQKDEAKRDEAGQTKEARWTTMPDLYKKTPEEAQAILAKAGFDTIEMRKYGDNAVCSYEGTIKSQADMVPQGAICAQEPAAGARVRAEKAYVRFLVEDDTYEHGGLDTSEWRRMPDVTNMSADAAKALLASKGFGADEFDVEDVGDRCPSRTVCDTIPRAGQPKMKSVKGTLSANLQ